MYRCTTRTYISSTYTKRCREHVCGRLAHSQSVSSRSQSPQEVVVYNIILYDECVPDLTWRESDSNGTTRTTDATEYRVAGPYTKPIGGDALSSTYYYYNRYWLVVCMRMCVCVANGPHYLSEHHSTSYSLVLLLLVIIIMYVLFPSTL